MKRTIFFLTLILFSAPVLIAQESRATELSLKECVQMAVQNNINVKTARIDKDKGELRTSEVFSALLPKINLSGNFQDNVQLPTTVLPGEIVGKPGTNVAFQMGSHFSAVGTLNLSQTLYNQTALVAFQLSKKSSNLSDLTVEKASEEIAASVAKLYFLTLTSLEQEKLIQENIARTEQLRNITKIRVDNGIGKQIDLDRVNVNLENYYTQLSNTQAIKEQQFNMIKFMLDIPAEDTVLLTDKVEMLLLQDDPTLISDFSNHVDIKLLESQQEINVLSLKVINSGYYPTLSFSSAYAYQGLRNEFSNYFNSSAENTWYPNFYIGLNLSVPIFDGFEKRSKARQSKLDYKKTQENIESTKESFSMNYKNAMNNYLNNKNIVRRQEQNNKLAEKVFKETSLKYQEGLSTMSDVLQDEISLSNAQSGYLTALYNFKDSELKIMSLNGDIVNLMNK